jgi:hypothetical protein
MLAVRVSEQVLADDADHDVIATTCQGSAGLKTIDTITAVSSAPLGNSQS